MQTLGLDRNRKRNDSKFFFYACTVQSDRKTMKTTKVVVLAIAIAAIVMLSPYLQPSHVWADANDAPQPPNSESPPSVRLLPLNHNVPAAFQFLFTPLEPGPASVSGRVTQPSGAPAADARVTLFRWDSWWKHSYAETTTKADGTYAFTNVPFGGYWLTAVSERGAAGTHTGPMDASILPIFMSPLGLGHLAQELTAELERTGRDCRMDLKISEYDPQPTTGHVYDSEGRPVAHAIVSTAGRPYLAGGLSMNVRTDENGAFALHHLPDGWGNDSCNLVAYAEGFARSADLRVPYGSTDNKLYLQPASSIVGSARFKDSDEPAAALQVILRSVREHEPRNVAITDANGDFVFDCLPPMEFELSIDCPEKGWVSIDRPVVDLRNGGRTEVPLLVSAGSSITGRIYVEETGEPLIGVPLWIPNMRTSEFFRTTTSQPDGTYRFENLPAGTYGVQCSPPEHVIRHFHYGDQGAQGPGQTVEIGAEEHVTGVDFVFPGGVTVSGRVVDADGKPIVHARMFAENNQRDNEQPPMKWGAVPLKTSSVYTDDEGRYSLRGFKPGDAWTYRMFVRAHGFGSLDSDPFTVTGDMEGKDFTLERAAIVSGRVKSLAGEPIPLMMLSLEPVSWQSKALKAGPCLSAADGGFTFEEGVVPGEYRIRGSGWFSPTRSVPYDFSAMNQPLVIEGTDAVIGLQVAVPLNSETATITGTLLASDTNRPLEGARAEVVRVVGSDGQDYGASGHFEANGEPGGFKLAGVYPGTVTIKGWADGYPKQEIMTLEVHAGEVVNAGEHSILPESALTACVEGTVLIDGAAAAEVAKAVYLRSAGDLDRNGQVPVESNGVYRAEKLMPGRYLLMASSQERDPTNTQAAWSRYAYAAVDVDSGYTYSQHFELGGACDLNVRIRQAHGTGDRAVTVGIPNPEAQPSMAHPWPLDEPQDIIASGRITESGDCVIRHLPPGVYIITASCIVGSGDDKQVLQSSVHAALEPGIETKIELEL